MDTDQKKKVNIAQGSPETLDKLHIFLREQRAKHPDKKLKTLEDAINFAIDEARKKQMSEKR